MFSACFFEITTHALKNYYIHYEQESIIWNLFVFDCLLYSQNNPANLQKQLSIQPPAHVCPAASVAQTSTSHDGRITISLQTAGSGGGGSTQGIVDTACLYYLIIILKYNL